MFEVLYYSSKLIRVLILMININARRWETLGIQPISEKRGKIVFSLVPRFH